MVQLHHYPLYNVNHTLHYRPYLHFKCLCRLFQIVMPDVFTLYSHDIYNAACRGGNYWHKNSLVKNRSFCDTSMKFGTLLLCSMKTCSKTGPQPELAYWGGGCGSHFSKWPNEFSITHISTNIKYRKLIWCLYPCFHGQSFQFTFSF